MIILITSNHNNTHDNDNNNNTINSRMKYHTCIYEEKKYKYTQQHSLKTCEE